MISKINISKVLSDHFNTFRDIDDDSIQWLDLAFFFGLPLAIAVAAVFWLKFTLSREILNTLIASFSVVVALLFNLLLLVYDIICKNDTASIEHKLKRKFLKEIYSNISYSIFISIIAVFLMVGFFFILPATNTQSVLPVTKLEKGLSVASVGLLINFSLTLLMILKRVHILLSKEMH